MARYRKIDPRIWNDAKFRALSDNARLVFFMLLTHPNMTALGAMRATQAGLAAEMGWSPEAFAEAFGQALRKGMAEHDAKACFVALPKFLKYNPPESPNVVKAWVGAVDLLPECDLKTLTLQRAGAYAEGLTEAFGKAFREAFAKAMPNQEQEQEQEPEQEPKDNSAAIAAGAALPVDPIWGSGLDFLVRKEIGKDQARSLLGKIRKEVGDVRTAELLQQAETEDITAPAAWLMAAAAKRTRDRKTNGTLPRDMRSDDDIAAANEAATRRLLGEASP